MRLKNVATVPSCDVPARIFGRNVTPSGTGARCVRRWRARSGGRTIPTRTSPRLPPFEVGDRRHAAQRSGRPEEATRHGPAHPRAASRRARRDGSVVLDGSRSGAMILLRSAWLSDSYQPQKGPSTTGSLTAATMRGRNPSSVSRRETSTSVFPGVTARGRQRRSQEIVGARSSDGSNALPSQERHDEGEGRNYECHEGDPVADAPLSPAVSR
jgi:hypothetical protein